MEYAVAFFLVTHVYAIAYRLRGLNLRVYRLSVVLLMSLAAICAVVALVLTIGDPAMTGRISNELVHALWLQSLICTVLSVRIAVKSGSWTYLSHSVIYFSLFMLIAMMKSLAS